jgi:hypothetical protein
MKLSPEQEQLREQYVITLVQATFPIQQQATDREVTIELLIEAADLLKVRLQHELEQLRSEQDRD